MKDEDILEVVSAMKRAIKALQGAIALMQDDSSSFKSQIPERAGAWWTREEQEFLERNWGRMPVDAIAKRLNRAVSAVQGRVSQTIGKSTLSYLENVEETNRQDKSGRSRKKKTGLNVW